MSKYTGNKNLIRNTGLNWDMELAAMRDTDYIFGIGKPLSGLADSIENPEKYLPTGELQRGKQDAMDCSPRSVHNDLETRFNYLIRNGILSVGNIKWLNDNSYLDEYGNVKFSDPFLAMMSNTTPQGNSLIAPHQSVRANGCIPGKILPPPPNFTWAQYHNKARITQEMIDLGLEFKKRFPTNYQRVYIDQFAAMKSIIGVAGYAWPSPVNGVYPRTNTPPNHAFIIYKSPIPYRAFDNYLDRGIAGDWIKQLAKDYKFYPHGYRCIVNENIMDEPINKKKPMLKRLKNGEKVFVCVGRKKYWLVDWSVLDDFKEVFGFKSLQEAQQSVVEVDESVLDGYKDGGILGNLSLLDFLFRSKTK